jgi:MFS family permease
MTPKTRPSDRIRALAIGTFFFANGASFASWIPRLGEIRANLSLSDTALGLTLLGGGIGGVMMSLAGGRIINRIGSRWATVITSVTLAALLPLIAVAPVAGILFVVLVGIGIMDGLTDVAMNTQALQLQDSLHRSIINRMHAIWSLGTLSGGIGASLAATFQVSLGLQLSVTAIILILATLVAAAGLIPEARHVPEHHLIPRSVGARGRIWVAVFGIGILTVLIEIPATDWAALLMAERFDLGPGPAGLGFIGFTSGMLIGRAGGDRIVDRFGGEQMRRISAVIAAIGILIATTGPVAAVSLLGFVIAGLGGSTLFPISVRRAGELLPGAYGVSLFSAGARMGILISSPVMGALSDLTTRSGALLILGGLAALVTAIWHLPESPAPAPHTAPDTRGTQ